MKNKKIKIILSMLSILFLGIANTALGAQDNIIDKITNKSFKQHVVLVSDGSGVNVFARNPRFKGISRKEKETLRNNEFKAALSELGVKEKNIIILADDDNKSGTHYELMEKTMLKFEQELGSVTHIAHHYKYDDHIMHRKNGEVLKRLSDEHKIKDARYFMKPKYIKYIPEDKREYYKSETEAERDRAKKAMDQYKVIDENRGKLGIGYTSAHSYFDYLYKDPDYTSVLSIY